MRILYVDPTSPIGHKNYNYGLLRNINKNCEVDLIIRKDYLDIKASESNIDKIYIIPDKFIPELLLKTSKNKYLYRIQMRIAQLQLIRWIKNNFDLSKYDLILFTSVEIISFCVATRLFANRCVFVDHGISDIESSRIRKFFWKNLNPKLEIIVLEQYIKSYMKDSLKINNQIWLVSHPLPEINTRAYGSSIEHQNKQIIYAPGLSNDEEFINYLILNKNKIPTGYKIVIRSKTQEVQFENLDVYKKRKSDKEYYGIMANSAYTLLPYDEHYNYKTSGVFFESVLFKKMLLINNNNTLANYIDEYPGIAKGYDGYEGFFELIKEIKEEKKTNNIEDFKSVRYNYSDQSIEKQLNSIIENEKT